MKLFRAPHHPDHWIGEEADDGALVIWPAEPRGYTRRRSWLGGRRGLEEVESALARGTGWPGGPVGRRPRAASPSKKFGIHSSVAEIDAWSARAATEGKPPSVWARDELNSAAERAARPRKP